MLNNKCYIISILKNLRASYYKDYCWWSVWVVYCKKTEHKRAFGVKKNNGCDHIEQRTHIKIVMSLLAAWISRRKQSDELRHFNYKNGKKNKEKSYNQMSTLSGFVVGGFISACTSSKITFGNSSNSSPSCNVGTKSSAECRHKNW